MTPTTREQYRAPSAGGRLGPGGRLAAGGRVPLRAARRVLGDRRAPSRSPGRRICSAAFASPRPRSAAGSASVLRAHLAEYSRSCRHRERRRARPAAGRLLPRRPARRAGAGRARRRSPRRSCSRCSARSSSAAPGRCCASRCRAGRGLVVARRATRTWTAFPSGELAEAETDARSDPRRRQRHRARRRRSRPDGPRRARPRAAARGRDARRWASPCGRPRPPPSRRAWARRASRRSSRARCSWTATIRSRPGASCGLPGAADRAARAGARAPHRGTGHRPDADVEGRTWVNSDGRRNMPSGEVFTGPLEDSAEGTIRFTVPLTGRRRRRGRHARFRAGRSSTRTPSAASLPAGDAGHRRRRAEPRRARYRHELRHRPRRSARSCSTRRSAGPSTSRSAAPIPRPAGSTSPPCTGT